MGQYVLTPWKFIYCLTVVALFILFAILLTSAFPNSPAPAISHPVAGETVITFQSPWFAVMGVAWAPLLILAVAMAYWIFGSRVQAEFRARSQLKPVAAVLGQTITRAVVMVLYAFLAIIAFVIVWGMTFGAYSEIREVALVGDEVTLRSLYTSWQIDRSKIARVTTAEEQVRQKVGIAMKRVTSIWIDDGRVFRSVRYQADPIGGPRDATHRQFASQVKFTLTPTAKP